MEPVYTYVRGKGWVIENIRPRPASHETRCNNCGGRFGDHYPVSWGMERWTCHYKMPEKGHWS